ncbi:MAG TPA: peptidylprolyl isomerase [Candidatus Moranbacteria bacterium]|nr:peptidylprolyl isomerase [Candidatus Moranbacteria bacterium]
MAVENKTGKMKVKASTVIWAVVLVALGAFIAALITTYASERTNPVGRVLSRTLPLPAATLGMGSVVSIAELEADTASLKKFYENQDFSKAGIRIDFSTEEGRKRLLVKEREVLSKLIEDKALEKLAREKGITVTEEDLRENVDKELERYGTREDVEKELERLYGWTLQDFKKRVVRPRLIQERLEKAVREELGATETAKQRIFQAQQELRAGADFAKVAEKYSEGGSGKEGGELGWVSKSQVIKELQEPLFGQEVAGEKYQITESEIGLHIAEVLEKKKEGGEDVVRVRQIFVRKRTFADWLADEMRKMTVSVPLAGMSWDEEGAQVEFSSQEMKDFEQRVRQDAQGDASMAF